MKEQIELLTATLGCTEKEAMELLEEDIRCVECTDNLTGTIEIMVVRNERI
jgi:hypothetical protein